LDTESTALVNHQSKPKAHRIGVVYWRVIRKLTSFSEAAIGLVFISSEYRLILDRNFIKIGAISLLILDSAFEINL